jgi:ATP-dependent DNA helicase RecG
MYHSQMRTESELKALLARLDGEAADDIESETLECKPWDTDPQARKSQIRELREAVICLANQRGGTILVGVADRKRTRQDAIRGVGTLDGESVRRDIYQGTDPPILVDMRDVVVPEGRVLAINVPRGLPPHSTTEGVAKIRVGKECRPLVGSQLARILLGRGDVDLTAQILPDATLRDIDPDAVTRLARLAETEGRKPDLARLSHSELLANLGLIREGGVTLSAVLLAGTSSALARHAPQHEVVLVSFRSDTDYDRRRNLRGPLVAVLDVARDFIETNVRLQLVPEAGFGELSLPSITWTAAREALLNAVVHRDWFVRQSVHVELRPDRLVVTSPGGFIGGVTAENVLRHGPMRRNPLLADVFEQIGLVNRAGMGVDRMYEELLRLGKALPRYDADEASVTLTLPTKSHEPFARFVAEEIRAGRKPTLDDLILLRAATDRGELDRWVAAKLLQADEESAATKLADLRERELLSVRGRGRSSVYTLARRLSDRLRGADATNLDLAFDNEAARTRVRSLLSERGRLTNADIRRLTGCSRVEVIRMMAALREEGAAKLEGRGRGASWVPGPTLAPAPSRRKGKRK